MELPSVSGVFQRVLVGDSVFEDAYLSLENGRLYVEFEAEDLANINIDIKSLFADV